MASIQIQKLRRKGLIVIVVMWLVVDRCSPDNEITQEKTAFLQDGTGCGQSGREVLETGNKEFSSVR